MNTLRTIATDYITREAITWNKLAHRVGLMPQTLYNFRDGAGLSGENTIKLANFLGLKLEDLK